MGSLLMVWDALALVGSNDFERFYAYIHGLVSFYLGDRKNGAALKAIQVAATWGGSLF